MAKKSLNGKAKTLDKKQKIHLFFQSRLDIFLFPLFFITLVLPNIVFSGAYWFESLALMKWVTSFAPIGIMSLLVGIKLVLSKNGLDSFTVDKFGAIWMLMAIALLFQPLWSPITSWSSFSAGWFFISSLFAVYIITLNFWSKKWLPVVLWGAAINGALNVFFAELQIRKIFFPLVYPALGNYVGNTAQQNMFGLWLAMSLLGTIYLLIGIRESEHPRSGWARTKTTALGFIFLIIAWGLWNTTSRSAILSFIIGFSSLLFIWTKHKSGKTSSRIIMVILSFLILAFSGMIFSGRGNIFITKTMDVLQNYRELGQRDSIWATSWTMFRMHPLTGVGIGHYKWNYLDAQREMLKHFPGMRWYYTYWAHNEFLHWLSETGIVGGILLVFLSIWWLLSLFRHLKTGPPLSGETIWAVSLLFLIWSNALWTRPFHHMENAVWMALAFGIANREILNNGGFWNGENRKLIIRTTGALMAFAAFFGLVFLGSGMIGDRKLRLSTSIQSPYAKKEAMEKIKPHLLVKDTAEKNLAYFFVDYADYTKNPDDYAEALDLLYAFFKKQPEIQELPVLIGLCSIVGNEDLLNELASYYKLGSYLIDGTSFYFYK